MTLRAAALLAGALTLGGCATVPPNAGQNPADPFERWNRQVYAFNDAVDTAVLKPAATTYVDVVPRFVRTGVRNFFGNFVDAWSAVNNFLQGKLANGMHDIVRVGTNTVFGLGGVIDWATEMGVDRQGEDLGQTLGWWGMPAGPYIVWPFLGPSNARDSLSIAAGWGVSPSAVFDDSHAQLGLAALAVVDTRANLLAATKMLDDIALDKYVFVRDAFLQRRRSQVWDGNPPDEPEPPEPPAAPASGPAK